jgi:hypothetical protein
VTDRPASLETLLSIHPATDPRDASAGIADLPRFT